MWNFLTRSSAPRARRRTPLDRRVRPTIETLEARCLLSADPVLEWNALMLQANATDAGLAHPDQPGPTRESRAFAIVSAAVYDAVNSIVPTAAPYLVSVPGFHDASLPAAVAEAAHDTLVSLYPQQKGAFDAALQADLAAISPGLAELKGVLLGKFMAFVGLAVRQNDGSNIVTPYTPGNQPGDHQPDPLHPKQGFLDAGWGNVRPFAVPNVEVFQAPPPPALTSADYTAAFNAVKTLGGDGMITPTSRTAEQTQIGIFWGYDGSPGLGTPPRLYNQIVRVIAAQEGNTVVQNARLFALVNLSMADAGIAAWDTKYDDNFWRPIVAIRAAAADGNPNTAADPSWTPLGAPCDNGCAAGSNFTPNFPAYVSGHASFGAATFEVLRRFYGRNDIAFSFTSDEFNGKTVDQNGVVRPVVTRHWNTLSAAEEENGQSRIYLGIHWSFDKVQGIKLGERIADFIFNHRLTPRQQQHAEGFAKGGAVAQGTAAQADGLAGDFGLLAGPGEVRAGADTTGHSTERHGLEVGNVGPVDPGLPLGYTGRNLDSTVHGTTAHSNQSLAEALTALESPAN